MSESIKDKACHYPPICRMGLSCLNSIMYIDTNKNIYLECSSLIAFLKSNYSDNDITSILIFINIFTHKEFVGSFYDTHTKKVTPIKELSSVTVINCIDLVCILSVCNDMHNKSIARLSADLVKSILTDSMVIQALDNMEKTINQKSDKIA